MQQDYNIWFGQRLKDIMDERGITAKALEEMSGVGRMTISRIIKGRYATADEVQGIAKALEVSIDRLRQRDVDFESWEVKAKQLIFSLIDELVEHIPHALGRLERGQCFWILRYLYYYKGELQKAYEVSMQSLNELRDYPDSFWQARGYSAAMISCVATQRYDEMYRLVEEAERVFADDFVNLANFVHIKAHSLYQECRYDEAFEESIKAYDLYKKINDAENSMIMLRCLADVEFFRGRLSSAIQFHEQATDISIANHKGTFFEVIASKDYAKLLLCMNETEKAVGVLDEVYETVLGLENRKLMARYSFIRALAREDADLFEEILSHEEASIQLKSAAATMAFMLHRFNGRHGDAQRLMFKFFRDLRLVDLD